MHKQFTDINKLSNIINGKPKEVQQDTGYILPIKGLQSEVPEEKVVKVYGEEMKIDQHGFVIQPLPEEPSEEYI